MWPFTLFFKPRQINDLSVLSEVLNAVDTYEGGHCELNDLSDTLIIGVQHLQESTANYIEKLKQRRATVRLLGKQYSTAKSGLVFNDIVAPNEYKFTDSFAEHFDSNLELLINAGTKCLQENIKIKRVILIDDGGKFITKFLKPINADSALAKLIAAIKQRPATIAAIEQTTKGLREWIDEFDVALKQERDVDVFPVINVASSYVKNVGEKLIIPQAFIDALSERDIDKNTEIGVAGYGSIGASIANLLKQDGYKNIAVYDPYNEKFQGKRYEKLKELVQNSKVVIGTTGRDIFAEAETDEHLNILELLNEIEDNIEFISASSEDIEFYRLKKVILENLKNFCADENADYKPDDPLHDQVFLCNGKKITLVKGGHPIGFLMQNGEAVMPLEDSQLITGALLSAIFQGLLSAEEFTKKINKLCAEFKQQSNLVKLHADFQRIVMSNFVKSRQYGEFASNKLARFDDINKINKHSNYKYRRSTQHADGTTITVHRNRTMDPLDLQIDKNSKLARYGYYVPSKNAINGAMRGNLINILFGVFYYYVMNKIASYENAVDMRILEAADEAIGCKTTLHQFPILDDGYCIPKVINKLEDIFKNSNDRCHSSALDANLELNSLYRRSGQFIKSLQNSLALLDHAFELYGKPGYDNNYFVPLLSSMWQDFYTLGECEAGLKCSGKQLTITGMNQNRIELTSSLDFYKIKSLISYDCFSLGAFYETALTLLTMGKDDDFSWLISRVDDNDFYFSNNCYIEQLTALRNCFNNKTQPHEKLSADPNCVKNLSDYHPCLNNSGTENYDEIKSLEARLDKFRFFVAESESSKINNLTWTERTQNHLKSAINKSKNDIIYNAFIALLDDFLDIYHLPKPYKDTLIKALNGVVTYYHSGLWTPSIYISAINSILPLLGCDKRTITSISNAVLENIMISSLSMDLTNIIPIVASTGTTIIGSYFGHKIGNKIAKKSGYSPKAQFRA